MKTLIFSTILFLISLLNAQFYFSPTPASGLIYGQAQLNGLAADDGDWVGAFRATYPADTLCVGASKLIINGGIAYMNMQIYGDDPSTPEIDGMVSGEDFILVLWDSSLAVSAINDAYFSEQSTITHAGWTNTNGAPLPGYEVDSIYNFISLIDLSVDDNEKQKSILSDQISFHYNYPNPFNPTTNIFFNLRKPASKIKINIFDIFGRNIKQSTVENITSGQQVVNWDGKNNIGIKVPSGLYFYEITSESFTAKGKMTLLK